EPQPVGEEERRAEPDGVGDDQPPFERKPLALERDNGFSWIDGGSQYRSGVGGHMHVGFLSGLNQLPAPGRRWRPQGSTRAPRTVRSGATRRKPRSASPWHPPAGDSARASTSVRAPTSKSRQRPGAA